jgi:phage tail-like protein
MADAKPPQPGPKPAAGPDGVVNPYRRYNYRIAVANADITGHFTRMEGMGMRIQPIPYAEGGSDGRVRQLPGPVTFTEVRLYYGIISHHQAALWSWLEGMRRNQRERRHVMIDLLGPDGDADVHGYVLEEAWISLWLGAELDALGRDIAVEVIGLTYENISRGTR